MNVKYVEYDEGFPFIHDYGNLVLVVLIGNLGETHLLGGDAKRVDIFRVLLVI